MSLRNVSMVTSPIVNFRLRIAGRGALCSYLLCVCSVAVELTRFAKLKVQSSRYRFSTRTAALPADRLSSPAAPVCSKRAALRRVTRKKRQRRLVDQLASLRKVSPRARASARKTRQDRLPDQKESVASPDQAPGAGRRASGRPRP